MANYILELRYCKCGCGLFFRCLPTSTAVYACARHNPEYSNLYKKYKSMGRPRKRPMNKYFENRSEEDSPSTDDRLTIIYGADYGDIPDVKTEEIDT